MKRGMFFGVTAGLAMGGIVSAFGLSVFNWQWWAIVIPMLIIWNIIYYNLKED